MTKRFPKTRYIVEVWSGGRESTMIATFAMGTSLVSAKRRADSAMRALAPIETTWALRGYAYEAFASVRNAERTKCFYHAYQNVVYVDSIADQIRDRGFAVI